MPLSAEEIFVRALPLAGQERAAILSSDVITIADLPEDPHSSPFEDDAEGSDEGSDEAASVTLGTQDASRGRLTLREHRDASERAYILETLKELAWNISRASVALGVERTNLHKKIRAYGIKRGEG